MDLVDNKLDLLKHDEGNLDAPPEFQMFKPVKAAEEESKQESTTTPTEIQEETVQ